MKMERAPKTRREEGRDLRERVNCKPPLMIAMSCRSLVLNLPFADVRSFSRFGEVSGTFFFHRRVLPYHP